MPRGYGYGNARLRARRSRLLNQAAYDELLGKTTIEEVVSALDNTPYQPDIEASLVRVGPERCVLEAVRLHLTRAVGQLRDFYSGQPRQLVDLLLRRWDRHNLLTILRGQSQGVAAGQVMETIVPVGQLDEVSLRELARQPDQKAAIDLLTTWRLPYGRPLRQVKARHGALPDLDQLELALNQFHYRALLEAIGPGNGNRALLQEHLRAEIDLLNIRTTLKAARVSGIDALVKQRYHADSIAPLLVEPGGAIPAGRLAKLAAEAGSAEDIIRDLSNSRYGAALQAGWHRSQAQGGRFAMIERELERWQAQAAAAMFIRSPLGIGIPIGYLSYAETEAANLRLIAQTVVLNLDRDFIRQELIILDHAGP